MRVIKRRATLTEKKFLSLNLKKNTNLTLDSKEITVREK